MDKTTATEAIKWIETSDACHYVLKEAWQNFKDKDPVDAYKNAQLLADICKARIAH